MSPADRFTAPKVAIELREPDARRRSPFEGDGDEILTSGEACQFLKIGRTKLWELTRANGLPAYRVGTGKTSGLRYKRSELLHWLERNRVGEESTV